MKILYCIPSYFRMAGMERVLTQKVNYFVQVYGFSVVVVTTDQQEKDTLKDIDEKVTFYHLPINFSEDLHRNILSKSRRYRGKNRQYRKSLESIIEKESPDICISMGGKEISFLPKIKDQSYKICELHFAKNSYRQFYKSRGAGILGAVIAEIMTQRMEAYCSKFHKLVVLTKRDEREWKRKLNNVTQIYNPFSPANTDICDFESKKVIAVGRLNYQKGFTYLIDAWVKVAEKHPDWALEIWGEGELRMELQQQIDTLQLENYVFLKGATDNIHEKYKSSSIFVMSSQYEGFPMVLLEASGHSLPLVSFDCETGPAEIIADGKNGFLVQLNDTETLGVTVMNLIDDVKLRKTMGDKGKLMNQNFHITGIMKQWYETLHENLC